VLQNFPSIKVDEYSFFFSELRAFRLIDVHGGAEKRSWKSSYLEHAKIVWINGLKKDGKYKQ
jgi:hypothetical protein